MSSEMCQFKGLQTVNEVRIKTLMLVEISCTNLSNETMYLHVLHKGFLMHVKSTSAIVWDTVDDQISSCGNYSCSEAY
jgi:hypothetical protein